METNNYLIVPGYGNSGPIHWQTYFENSGSNFRRIHQASWTEPICNDWVENINKVVDEYPHQTVVLISHSMGGVAIAQWAKKYKKQIKGAMIVAPPDLENPYKDYNLQSFIPIPLEPLPFKSVAVVSTNDYWSTLERSKFFAQSWGSDYVEIGDAGHINHSSGYGDWPEGLDILKKYFET